jgi:hypothetical protein
LGKKRLWKASYYRTPRPSFKKTCPRFWQLIWGNQHAISSFSAFNTQPALARLRDTPGWHTIHDFVSGSLKNCFFSEKAYHAFVWSDSLQLTGGKNFQNGSNSHQSWSR